MRKSLTVFVMLAAVLTFLAVRLETRAAIVPPGKTVTLMWDYPQMSPDIVFNVYQTTNPGAPKSSWTVVTNLSSTSCVLPVQSGSHFFTVAASNTVTRLESNF